MAKKMTGWVPGGVQEYRLPGPINLGDVAAHASGRLNTMAEIVVQATCLRAHGFVNQATGYKRGARYQDQSGSYEGTLRVQAAHRAMFNLHLDGFNAPSVPKVAARPQLQKFVEAPLARTDLVMRAVNQADECVERAASDDVFRLAHATLQQQAAGRPVEKSLVMEMTSKLQRLLHDGYERAGNLFVERRRNEGRIVYKPGHHRPPLAALSDREMDDIFDAVSRGERGGIDVGGAKAFGDLVVDVLKISQQITDKTVPDLSVSSNLDAVIDTIDSASKEA